MKEDFSEAVELILFIYLLLYFLGEIPESFFVISGPIITFILILNISRLIIDFFKN